MVRWLLIMVVVLGAILGPAPPVNAAAEWCDTDPLILVVTPGGNVVPVFILVGVQGLLHFPAVQAASLLATSAAAEATAGGRATRVTITVTVADDLFDRGFPVRTAASTGPLGTGTVHATAEGTSGAPLALRFTLDIP